MAKSSSGSMLPWLGLALIILIADQFTKLLILGSYRLGDSTTITSFFNIVRAHNTGAAFSFLAGASGWDTPAQARRAVFAWSTRYNTRRRHSACGQTSANAYEASWTPATLPTAA